MYGALLALLVLVGGAIALSRRGRPQEPDEPWRASLPEEGDEPLDMDAIRRAEDEFLAEEWEEEPEDDEPWR